MTRESLKHYVYIELIPNIYRLTMLDIIIIIILNSLFLQKFKNKKTI